MTVCLDTNVLVQARSKKHPFHPILRACVLGTLQWAVSTRILNEYQEIITTLDDQAAWKRVELLLQLVEAGGTLVHVSPYYEFHVISSDPDDNAFTDCAITAHADYVITEDRHFAPLADAGYKPQPIAPLDFIQRYRGVYV